MGPILTFLALFLSRRFFHWVADARGRGAPGQRRRRSLPPQAGGTELAGLDLRGADLSRRMLWRGDLAGRNLSDADLGWSNLREARLMGADLRGARLRGAKLEGIRYDESTHWPWRGRPTTPSAGIAREVSPALPPSGRGDEVAAPHE